MIPTRIAKPVSLLWYNSSFKNMACLVFMQFYDTENQSFKHNHDLVGLFLFSIFNFIKDFKSTLFYLGLCWRNEGFLASKPKRTKRRKKIVTLSSFFLKSGSQMLLFHKCRLFSFHFLIKRKTLKNNLKLKGSGWYLKRHDIYKHL